MPEPRKFIVNGIECEEEILTEQELMDIAHPMVIVGGVKRVACTQCRKRPLVIARLCRECYDERMAAADWRAKLGIVKRGKGRPKLVCPWCGHTERGWVPDGLWDACCKRMKIALYEIMREESAYERSNDIDPEWDVEAL